jgi:hypothetical protein
MLYTQMDPMFDHEKLDVYGLELEFIRWLTEFFDEASESKVVRRGELIDQLDRASMSVLFNTAEGNGRAVSELNFSMMPAAPLWNALPAWTRLSQSGLRRMIAFSPASRP